MAEEEDKHPDDRARMTRQRQVEMAAEQRKARAAEKLRENLLRRKAQVRARRQGEAETGVGLPASRVSGEDGGSGQDGET